MAPDKIDVIVNDDPENPGQQVLGSPTVGAYSSAPKVGEVVVGGSRAGRLTTLGRMVELVVPHGVTGRVVERNPTNRSEPVEYGQELLRLAPVEVTGEGVAGMGSVAAADDLPEGTLAVRSSIHGMFYHRPRPDEPAYVEIGQIVENGTTLGLVEVMKCFSAVVYGGGGLPTRAEISTLR